MGYKTVKEQKPLSDAFLKAAGCRKDGDLLPCLQALSTAAVINATGTAMLSIWQNLKSAVDQLSNLISLALPWTPTVGSEDLAKQPHEAFKDGTAMRIPLLAGTVKDEGIMFVDIVSDAVHNIRGFEYGLILSALFGLEHGHEVQRRYPADGIFKPIDEQLANILTDHWFKCGTQKLALYNANASQRTFQYRYIHPTTEKQLQGYRYLLPNSCLNQTCHAMELPFLFGNIHYVVEPTVEERRIEGQLMDLWGSFIRGEDVPVADHVPAWPTLNESREGLLLGDGVQVESERDLCEFWDRVGTYNTPAAHATVWV